ncbi:MAG: DUF58 domain-containing protein [Deltaproteobacteria bacterium]|nr:DUF58 domain-containing protein [Deltaproteobacteria bacterium]
MKRLRSKFFNRQSKDRPYTPLPWSLSRKRIYILPTRHGWRFLLVLMAMLIGSINYKNNLGFLLTFLLGSMALVSILHTYRNLSRVQILSAAAAPVFSGGQAVFKFLVRAETHDRAAVFFKLMNGGETRKDLTTGRDNWIDISVNTAFRGIFNPGDLRITSQYPFGFFYAWSRLHLDLHCVVFPKPVHSPFEPIPDSSSSLDDGRKNRPGVDDFQGLKSYQPGDSLQHISWKAFSRGQGLFTKQFIGQTGASVILDWGVMREANTELKLSWLCDMVIKAQRLNLTYGLKLPGKTIDPDRGDAHRQKCLKALAHHGF